VTTDGELARLRGAGATALQRHSGYYRSTHPSTHTPAATKHKTRVNAAKARGKR